MLSALKVCCCSMKGSNRGFKAKPVLVTDPSAVGGIAELTS